MGGEPHPARRSCPAAGERRVSGGTRGGAGADALICVLGDAHIDVVVALSGTPARETDTPVSTVLAAGGQAANVAAWVAAVGGRSRLIAARGTDAASRLVGQELQRRGVELVGPVVEGTTGVVVSLSDGATRSMLTDRGVGPLLSAGAFDDRWLTGCAWLHLPAYSLVAGPVAGAALAAARAAAARSARLSVDLSSTAALTGYGVPAFRALLARLAPHLVFGTAAEMALLGPLAGPEVVVKLGADGVCVGGRHYPAAPARAVDATGAGDAFAAGYLVGGVQLGLRAAARAVARLGAMP
jgi:sugar/nucleoside kinase (ribokinase family)